MSHMQARSPRWSIWRRGGLGGSGGVGLNCWEQDATELLYRLVNVRPLSLLPAKTMPAAPETSWKLYGLMPRGSCSCTHSPVKLVPSTSVIAPPVEPPLELYPPAEDHSCDGSALNAFHASPALELAVA